LWQKAKKYITGLILNKVMDIKNINLEMVRAGLAEVEDWKG
jgi:hypothetical protein